MSNTTELARALQPLGLTCRMFRGEVDLQANVDLNNLCARADGDEHIDTLEQARNRLAHSQNGDPCDNMVMIETPDHSLVAKGEVSWWKNEAGAWNYDMGGCVHPNWRRKGIGRAVLNWTESRAHEISAQHADNGDPAYYSVFSEKGWAGQTTLLQQVGYQAIRHSYSMLRELSVPVSACELPDGIEVRPTQPEMTRQIWEAFREAFRDHWGYREWVENDYQSFLNWQNQDPSLWVIAWQGDEVVGGCMNSVMTQSNEAFGTRRGELGLIAVRRPWRKRGIAKATIARSLEVFKARGLSEAMLYVDAQGTHGALPLYEGMGFQLHKVGTVYHKPLTEALAVIPASYQ